MLRLTRSPHSEGRPAWSLPVLLATAMSALVFAGCIGDDTPGAQVDEAVTPQLDDALALLEAGEPAANLDVLGRLDDGGNQEVDAWGDYLFVMRNPDLVILDISDPTDILEVSRITLPAVKDVKVSDDGNYAFVGHDGSLTEPIILPDSKAGFYVLDVSDKANPKEISYLQVGPKRGPHMVFYHQTPDGRELVFGANADISINEFDRSTGQLTELARYQPNVVTDWNRDPEVIDAYYQGYAHDMFVMDDPVTNQTLMYVANWDAGLRIVDVTDPANPSEIGKWMDYPAGHSGNLHTVSTEWQGDRRITVGSPELGFSVVGGYHYAMGDELTGVYVWDTTDPAAIELLSYWSHPEDECRYAKRDLPGPEGTPLAPEGITSSHNLQFENGRVYMAHYDCGVVVLDLGTDTLLEEPQLLGYFRESGMHTWDVVLHKGVMYLGDSKALFGLHFVTDELGEDGITSRA